MINILFSLRLSNLIKNPAPIFGHSQKVDVAS